MTYEFIKECPACSEKNFTKVYENLTDTLYKSSTKTWTMYKCTACESLFLNPRYDIDSISEAYKKYHTHGKDAVNGNNVSIISYIKRSVSNAYRNKKYGTSYGSIFPLGFFIVFLLRQYKEQIDSEFRCIKYNKRNSKRILDVGFGGGSFLKIAQDLGWQSFGVDTDPVTVINASKNGFAVELGGIEKFANYEEFFDCVTISHVIEHVHDPRETLRIAFAILKPGGTLWIETPNSKAIGHDIFGRDWRGLEPPRHLTIFSWSGIEKALHTVGFIKLKKRPRVHLFKPMAKASSRTSENSSENIFLKIKILIGSPFIALMSIFNSKYCEFITIEAIKPGNE